MKRTEASSRLPRELNLRVNYVLHISGGKKLEREDAKKRTKKIY